MSAGFAITVTRWWTRVYTLGLPAELRAARREEIESDLWESLHDPDASPQILPRLAGGVVDDVCWRATHVADESRTVALTVATGCLLLVAMWEWLARPAISGLIIGSTWVYPVVQSTHVLSIALFLGLSVILDLRLLGVTLRRLRVSELVADMLPWIAPSSFLTLVTGMLLFIAEPDRFVANPFFRLKAVALVLAVINLLVFHVAFYSRVEEWDQAAAPPRAARVCAVVSLALWSIVVIASRLIAYNWFS